MQIMDLKLVIGDLRILKFDNKSPFNSILICSEMTLTQKKLGALPKVMSDLFLKTLSLSYSRALSRAYSLTTRSFV